MAEELVVQVRTSDATDFDSLIEFENGLIELFVVNRDALVEGHELGPDMFQVFIRPAKPWETVLARLRAFLEFSDFSDDAVVARRSSSTEAYEVVWPT